MKKFNIVLVLFLVAQSSNSYSMNAVRRAASRAATYVNRLAPKARDLVESLLKKSRTINTPTKLHNNISTAIKQNTNKKTSIKNQFSLRRNLNDYKYNQENQRANYLKYTLIGLTTFGLGCLLEPKEQLYTLDKFNLNYNGLLDILKQYKTTNVNWHAGDLYEHSIWVAKAVENWFATKDEWVTGLSEEDKEIAIIAGLLHDIGKAGDLQFNYYAKKNHPYDGFLYLLSKKIFYTNEINTFNFDQWFKENNISENNKKIIAILVGIHWEFGRILKELNKTKRNFSRKYLFDKFLEKLSNLAKEADYNNGIIDERLLRLAILINAADLKGTSYVSCCSNNTLELSDSKAVHAGQNVYKNFEYETKGKFLRKELIKYFNDRVTLESLLTTNTLPKNTSEHNHMMQCLKSQTRLNICIQFLKEFTENQQLQKSLEKKYELEKAGYLSFFHAQSSKFGFLQDFTKELLNIMVEYGILNSNALRHDFLFIQNPNIITNNSGELLKKAKLEQKQLLIGRDSKTEPQRNPKRLSVNTLLSGNTLRMRSCTWNFAKNNFSTTNFTVDLYSNLLNKLNIPLAIAKKYQDRFNELINKHKSLFRRGRILLIGIPKKFIDQTTYISAPDAYKTHARCISGQIIDNVSDYNEIAKNTPSKFNYYNLDKKSQAVVILTQAYALNPYSDVKIFAFDPEPTNQAEYEQYLKERRQLAEDIARDIAELNAKEHFLDGYEVCCKEITKAAKKAAQG